MPRAVLHLRPGREKPLLRRHPWIFSGAIQEVIGSPAPGEVVDIKASDGSWLAYAAYSPRSKISARVLSWQEDEPIDRAFLRERLLRSIVRRENLLTFSKSNAWREVFSEADGLPGLVVDRYDDVRVLQLTTAWADGQRDLITDLLEEIGGCSTIFERSDADVRELEGLQPRVGLLWGRPLEDDVVIHEAGLRIKVDIEHGHKTGTYLDQRDNRAAVAEWSAEADVLDAFCYSGGFGLGCLAAGARHITFLDSSPAALSLVDQNLKLNGLDGGDYDLLQDDVFKALRSMRDRRAEFDLIILDPPKFAPTAAQAGRASRAYKDINLLALKLLKPGGLLATFSCSGGVPGTLFQKIVSDAALDAGVSCRIIRHFEQAADHPVDLTFPEGSYLKGLLLRVG